MTQDLNDYLTAIANSENCKIKVHKNCRRDYTNKRRSIDLSDKGEDKSPSERLRSHAVQLDWKTKCFFCAETVDERFLLGQQVFFHLRVLSSNSGDE